MHIWVDADACPAVIKEILFAPASALRFLRRWSPITLRIPNQPQRFIQVTSGFDVADNFIVQQLQPDDLSSSLPIFPLRLGDREKGVAINPRGTLYTESNIRQRLAMRNFMEEMRSIGQASGGPPPLNKLTDKHLLIPWIDC